MLARADKFHAAEHFVAAMGTTQAMSRKIKESETRKELIEGSYKFWKDCKCGEVPFALLELAHRILG